MTDARNIPNSSERNPPPGIGRRIANVLTSLRFAVTVVVLLAIACVIGTILPQGTQVAQYLHAHPEAGARMKLLMRIGFTHVYSSWWFLLLLGLLAASLAVCTYRRYDVARKATGRARGRAVGSILTHVSLLLILLGGIVRGAWGQRGQLAFREGETKSSFVVDGKAVALPFSVRLENFETEMYARNGTASIRNEILAVTWPAGDVKSTYPVALGETRHILPRNQTKSGQNGLYLTVKQRIPDFVVDMQTREVHSRSDEPLNPAVLVEIVHAGGTNTTWLFARFPDFNMHSAGSSADAKLPCEIAYRAELDAPPSPQVKDYKSTLQIIEDGAVVLEKTIEVNAPLAHRGYRLYQSGFNPQDPKWTSLQVVRDPGVPLVYAGFAIMISGLVMVFYVYPVGPGLTTQLASQEDSRHDDDV